MSEIPEDVVTSAERAAYENRPDDDEDIKRFNKRFITIARAILAERRRCAEAVTRLKGGQYIDRGAAQSAILNP